MMSAQHTQAGNNLKKSTEQHTYDNSEFIQDNQTFLSQQQQFSQFSQQQYNFINYSRDHHQSFDGSYARDQSSQLMDNDFGYLTATQGGYAGEIFTPDPYASQGIVEFTDQENEMPLLEELGIDPDRIFQKTLAVLNPFHRRGQIDDASYLLQDSDLAGPVAFWLLLAAFLLLAGSKAHFGYVYGLAATSCMLMYILLTLMSSTGNITLISVSSVLGYCIIPVVGLSSLGIFMSLRGIGGLVFAVMTVFWSSISASRLFIVMSGDEKQRLLIAYPCILLYGIFTLIVIF